MKSKNKSTHITTGNVFEDIGLNAEQSSVAKIKYRLMEEILEIVKTRNLKQRDLQKLLDVPQPRISELLTGKIAKMSIEKLLGYLDKLGKRASISFRDAA